MHNYSLSAWFISLLSITFLFPPSSIAGDEVVNLYSARKERLIKPLLDDFTQQTGIKVRLITGKADALLKRLQSEGRNSPADLLLTTDAGRLYRAKQAGVLQPIQSKVLETAIASAYRDQEGYWYGLSLRARPIVYVKARVDPKNLSTYEALADSQWHKKICIRSSSNIYNQSLVASMINTHGIPETETWVKGLVANLARRPTGGDRDQIKAAAAGVCDIAIVNTYYLGTMLHSKEAKQREAAAKVAIYWPNQTNRGTHVNISGIAVTKSAKHKDNAIKLMEFLVSDTSQQWYAEVNHEYPSKTQVQWSDTLESWGKFKVDEINMESFGKHNSDAVKIMDRAGWR